MRKGTISKKAAGALAAFFLCGAAAPAFADDPVEVSCRVEPRVLDVSRPAGALTVRIEAHAAPSSPARSAAAVMPDLHVSSVNGLPLPVPSPDAEGIAPSSRAEEDGWDVRGRAPVPNGVPELVARFDRPSDGDPATAGDGDAGDILAMVMDVPDGSEVEVCLSATGPGGSRLTCCDTVTIRNRGLRDLPRGLHPGVEP